MIVNGTNTSPNWTSAKMGSGSGISITDIISSDHESTVYYRYAASSKDKKFAGKPESITIPKRTAAPAMSLIHIFIFILYFCDPDLIGI